MEHTKEPWRTGRKGSVVADEPIPEMHGSDAVDYYGGHCVAESVVDRNARRIVACVNACAGIKIEDLEALAGTSILAKANASISTVEKHLDELLAALEREADHISEITTAGGKYHGISGRVVSDSYEEAAAARSAIASVKGQ